MKLCVLFFAGLAASAEPRVLTLKEAMDLAQRQNPDVILARLDEQRAALEVRAVAEPVVPRVVVGSGLAWTTGFPLSIEGSAPSLFRTQANRALYNAPQAYQVAQTKQLARSSAIVSARTREEAALRTAVLFLDLEKIVRGSEVARHQVENLERVDNAVRERVAEGREIELEARRSGLNLARARQRLASLGRQQMELSQSLAEVLGLPTADELRPALEDRADVAMPASEEDSVSQAVQQNKEVQRLESDLLAKGLEAKSFRAAKLPKIDLVAQYAMFARFNNYEDYFRTFSRHNAQLGASIQIPVLPDSQQEARAAQADIEGQRLRADLSAKRNHVQGETRKAWQRIREAESRRELAKLDLDVWREQISVLLAQADEGRATLRQVEEARFQENERWLLYYDARYAVERARLELLKETGALLAAVR